MILEGAKFKSDLAISLWDDELVTVDPSNQILVKIDLVIFGLTLYNLLQLGYEVAMDKRVFGSLKMDSDDQFFKSSLFGMLSDDSQQVSLHVPVDGR